jgi:hypothetical protein
MLRLLDSACACHWCSQLLLVTGHILVETAAQLCTHATRVLLGGDPADKVGS